MNKLIELYQEAEKEKIDVVFFPMKAAASVAIPMPDDSYAVALNPAQIGSVAQHTVCLGHELGHCITGSFYNRYTPLDIWQKHENRADKWAILQLVPKDELRAEVQSGNDSTWSLAERFDVTEDFMKKAICFYKHGNLAVDAYI